MDYNTIIGKNLAALREKRGLTQEEAAMYLGVSRPVISYYETAQREIPLIHLEKLADLFCVEVADLTAEEPSVEQQASFAFAFRTDGLSAADLQSIGSFQKVVKNYLKLKRLSNEKEQSHRA
ncbi:MAG: helix-turn-helix transcriptional regulator [Bacteroidetes bacterium]|nr:helix-turn-helix transcriptional regulator [Bacteroidota bacterium]